MDKKVSNFMTTMVVIVMVLLVATSNLIPVLGVSLVSYALGSAWVRFERIKRYQIGRQFLVLSLFLGELLFFAVFGFLVFYVVEFFSPGLFWRLMLIGLLVNLSFAYLFFKLGIKISQRQLAKESG